MIDFSISAAEYTTLPTRCMHLYQLIDVDLSLVPLASERGGRIVICRN